jgi:V/A-type H+-transporting ATPase subunit D
MAREQLSKAALHKQQARLKSYERFLPSLDLKRRQLLQELRAERAKAEETREKLAAVQGRAAGRLPMLANLNVDLAGLVQVAGVELAEENRLGTRLPVLAGVATEVRPYGYLAKPHWVDALAAELARAAELSLAIRVGEERVARLEAALKVVTQRVNLFEKVLIPRTRTHIRKIQVYLSDAERAAVVRAKIAKSKRAARAPEGRAAGEAA